jgi:pyruvate,water dikinase
MLWRGVVEICQANAYYWRACIQNRVCGPIERTFAWLYRHFVERHDRPPVSVFLRGHDSEPVRAERALFQLAQEFRDDAEIEHAVAASPTEQLMACLEGGERGQRFLSLFRAYLRCYGHQFFTLDFKEPTLGEQPAPLLETVKSFLTTPTGACHRSVLFREERDRAEAQLRTTLDSVRWTLLRWILRLLNYALVLREDVLFFLGLGWPTVRRFILELGRRTAQNGWIETDEDVFFLTQTELQAILAKVASPDHAEDLQRKIRERRNRWSDQAKLKPPVLIPGNFRKWGMRISSWMPETAHANTGRQISGVAVSHGMATGPAVVIMSHEGFHKMKAGCVLVAPMTTPAWTPLFNLAKAVVTDVGGLLSHTSIVAREYGIPAVIGTGVATQRIADGQIVTVDGDRGRIVLEHD